jgi:hypothetical protein
MPVARAAAGRPLDFVGHALRAEEAGEFLAQFGNGGAGLVGLHRRDDAEGDAVLPFDHAARHAIGPALVSRRLVLMRERKLPPKMSLAVRSASRSSVPFASSTSPVMMTD